MLKKHLASVLLGLGAISPFVAQADQPAMRNQQSGQQKKMVPQFDMGDPIEPGQPGHPGYVPAAYNYPAGIRAPNQDWDVYVTGAFIWWKPHQDNMFTGTVTNQTTPALVDEGMRTSVPDMDNQITFTRKPSYKPGFKVGLGWNTGSWDNWTLYAEYTWFHTGEGKDDSDDDCGECGCGEQVVIVPTCNCPGDIVAADLESNWKIDLDIADLVVARPAYQGKRLVLSPFFGLRAMWLKQRFNVEWEPALNNANAQVGEFEQKEFWKSWALGPRLGVDGSWLLGAGFRFVGNASASLLYARYTDVKFQSNVPGLSDGLDPSPLSDTIDWKLHKNYGTVRPNFEIDAGLGWGMYIGDEFHLDFAVTYDFHAFFAENMGAAVANWALNSVDTGRGNFYLHGLTVKARFDF